MKTLKIVSVHASLVLGIGLLSACGSGVALQAPDDFVVLDEDHGSYDVRATNAHGVVVAAREVPNDPRGSLSFWIDAIKNRLRTMGGYALLEEKDVTAASGEQGKQLRFGRDEGGHPFVYWLTVFATDDSIYLLEAGGRQEIFEPATERVERAMASIELD